MEQRQRLGYLPLALVLAVAFWSGQALAGSLVEGYKAAAGDTWWLLTKDEVAILLVRLQEKSIM